MWPDKAQYRPGDLITLHASGAHSVHLRGLGHLVATLPVVDGRATWEAPDVGEHAACGFWAEAVDQDGAVLATTAFDVARHWSVAPRYGFLSDFKPGDSAAGVASMNRLHLNVIQYYDWMYTHYQFFADSPEFTDPMGRQTSHTVLQAKIDECHRHGMACLAYGAMYGGEKPILDAHPEWHLYKPDGTPFDLINLFYIQNVERGCGWRDMILGEYEAAMTRLGFDGIHIDQYGWPRWAIYRPSPGEERVVDVATAIPDFVAEAGERTRQIRPDGGNIFNCVNAWPVEWIAPLQEHAATYIEVWSPHDTYRDLQRLIRYARLAGPHKQVILAAYLDLYQHQTTCPAGGLSALRLASAAIYASGGFHLLLGEGNGVLGAAYYPDYGRLSPEGFAQVQQYYDFITAYGELLHDRELRDVNATWGGLPQTAVTAPVGTSPLGETGKVWTVLRDKPGRRIIHLINLHGLEHDRWNAPQATPTPVDDIAIYLMPFSELRAVWYASPDDGGRPRRLAVEPVQFEGNAMLRVSVPRLDFWSMVWTEE